MTSILWRIVCTTGGPACGERFVADLQWEPRAMWLGLSWSTYISTARRRCLRVYLCLLPLVPLRVSMVLWRVHQAWPGDGGTDDEWKEEHSCSRS